MHTPSDSQKSKIPTLMGAFMVLITILLGVRFYLMIYFPGTPKNRMLYALLAPHWDLFSSIVLVLKTPLILVAQVVWPHASSVFPEMLSAEFLAFIAHQPASAYITAYPGRMEWLTLLAIPFWNLFLFSMALGLNFLRESISLSSVVEQSGQILADYQQKQKIEQAYEQRRRENSLSNAIAQSTANQATTQSRLLQSKNLSANMPKIHQPSQQEIDQYKKQEGDLMVRDMVNQLQRENASLQARSKHLESTFSQYFSPQVLQYLENNKGVFQNVENERHMISVLFCDIRGFSTYSQTATPDELVKFLGEYFDIASYHILHKYNGIVSKLMGDGLMAYWGFPVPNPDHAYIATLAAMDILRDIELRNQKKPDVMPLQIGIGIATGEAIVGNIGSTDFKDFTLIGTPVNMAARLEEANKQLGTSLLISETTYAALNGRINCRHFGGVQIRGWQNSEHVYSPVIS